MDEKLMRIQTIKLDLNGVYGISLHSQKLRRRKAHTVQASPPPPPPVTTNQFEMQRSYLLSAYGNK